nr:RecName: Full=Venom peptide Ocy5 [Opisthacanthus cayaporum]
LGKSVTN